MDTSTFEYQFESGSEYTQNSITKLLYSFEQKNSDADYRLHNNIRITKRDKI